MSAFRKRKNLVSYHPEGVTPNVTVPVSKTVVTKDNPEPTVYIEMKTQTVEDYSKVLGLPRDEDYQLRDMIASGRIPDEVPVSGILDSNDPTDLQNIGREDAIMERLTADVDSRAQRQPSTPVSTPAPDIASQE